jgi:DnaJ-class molecular chaperone
MAAVASGECKLCGGKGSFGAFGACLSDDVHVRGACPCCNGSKYSSFTTPCATCSGTLAV